jgi:CRP-like cAMP-binding protein|tara:strand:- start:2395 stop:3123 length:729 start_codon:yes stop_codon:yes gene_type:complete
MGSGIGVNGDSNNSLLRVRLLENLDSEAIASLEKRSRWRRYARDEQILDRDSGSRDVFLVVEGSVEVVNYSISGREVAFGHVSAGGYFGELSAIDGGKRSANIVAIESSLVLIVPPEVFTEILTHNPPAAMQVLRRLAHIIRTADDRIMDLSTLKAVQRVYIELMRLSEEDEKSGHCIIRPLPTQRDMARRASTSRETVARVLGQLARAEIVERKGRTLHIHDMERLTEMTDAQDGDEESLR